MLREESSMVMELVSLTPAACANDAVARRIGPCRFRVSGFELWQQVIG
jgi:hypothetical protein